MSAFLPPEELRAVESLDLLVDAPAHIPEIPQLLQNTLLVGGKRLRPALCFLMGRLLGVSTEKLAPFARAAELTHAATLAHDDVTDEAERRRNRPTLNAVTGNSRAVLTGDLLLARVLREIADQGNPEVLRDMTVVYEDLVTGEWLQLEARGKIDVTRELLERIARHKTGSLLRWCCSTPARLAERGPEFIRTAEKLGETLGLAFQMIDDVIDFEVGGEKPFAQDLREGTVNFVTLAMIERRPELSRMLAETLGRETRTYPWTDEELADARESVREQAARKMEEADEYLNELARAPHDSNSLEWMQLLFAGMACRTR
jgi:geranylgeranyl pyrophosphate synthase